MRHALSVLLVFAFALPAAPSPAQPADSPWPMFKQNDRRTGLSAYEGPSFPGLVWSYTAGDIVESSPSLGTDGDIYFGDRERLYALDAGGGLLWSYHLGTLLHGPSPAVGNGGRVHIGNYDGRLMVLGSDGALAWSYMAAGEIVSSPAITEGTGRVYIGSYDNRLYALDPDGGLAWSFDSGDDVAASPAVTNLGRVYVGSWQNLYAIGIMGNMSWSYGTQSRYSSPSVSSDGSVHIGSGGEPCLYSIGSDGALEWTHQIANGATMSSPAIGSDGTVYVGSMFLDIYAVDSAGDLAWSYKTGDEIHSSPAIGSGGNVYYGSNDNVLYVVGSGGGLQWSYATAGDVKGSPSLGSDGSVYLGSWDKVFYCLGQVPTPTMTPTPTRAPTRTPTRTPTPVPPTATPVPQAEVVLNGTEFSAGSRFTAAFRLNRSVERLFTAYAVVVLPDGSMLNCLTLGPKIVPVASNVPGLAAPYEYPLMDLEVPAGMPGSYEVMAGFFDPSQPITKPEDAFLLARSPFTVR